jgi:cytochrome c oxidase subunit I+III
MDRQGTRVITVRKVGDVSALPQYAFGPGVLTWWGMLGMMFIEGITLVLVAASYIYLRHDSLDWPPAHTSLPSLGIALVEVAVLTASVVPAVLAARAAKAHDKGGVLRWLAIQTLLGALAMGLRIAELPALNVRWDSSAYGSATWAVLIAHAFVMVTDVLDSAGLMLLFLLVEPEERHYVDTTENSIFWYFIVGSWLPLFVLAFLYPRW